MIRLTDTLTVNPARIVSCEIDNRFYMNGSDAYLVVRMDDGKVHRLQHGYGVDVHKIKGEIERHG